MSVCIAWERFFPIFNVEVPPSLQPDAVGEFKTFCYRLRHFCDMVNNLRLIFSVTADVRLIKSDSNWPIIIPALDEVGQ